MNTPGIGADRPAALSCHAIERLVCEVWSEFFERDVHPDDDFYTLGGDSVAIVETVHAARQRGLALRSSEALRNPTPARLAEYLTVGGGGGPAPSTALETLLTRPASEPIIEQGDGTALYLVHSDSHLRLEQDTARHWGSLGPVSGFRLPTVARDATTIADLVESLIRALRSEQAAGPYRLAGFGIGAVLAFELGRRLRADGDEVDFVALIGPPTLDCGLAPRKSAPELFSERLSTLARRFVVTGEQSPDEVLAAMREAGWYEDVRSADELSAAQWSWARLASAIAEYEPPATDFPIVLIQDAAHTAAMDRGWPRVLGDAKSLWLDHGTASPRSLIQDPRSLAFMREVLAP